MARRKTMFFPPKYPSLAKIVRIDSPKNARKAVKTLLAKFKKAKRRDVKVRVKRAAVLAGNRAKAMLRRKNLSAKERKEMREVYKIYRRAVEKMKLG